MFLAFLVMATLMVLFLAYIVCQKPTPESPASPTLPRGRERQRASSLLQKARDAELWEFVQSGNREWALRQLAQTRQQADPVAIEGAVEDTLLMWGPDPFNDI